MKSQFKNNLEAIKYMLLACFFSSCIFIFVKYLKINQGFSIFQIVSVRSLLSLLSLLPLLFKAKINPLKTKRINWHLVRGLCGGIGITIYFYLITKIKISEAVALAFLVPLMNVILSIFILKERFSSNEWLLLSIGILGSFLIVKPEYSEFKLIYSSMLAVILLYSFADVAIKKLSDTEDPKVILFYFSSFAFLCTIPFALKNFKVITFFDLVLWIGLVFVGNMSQIYYAKAFAKTSLSFLQLFDFSKLIFSAILAYFFFGEVTNKFTVIGTIFIIVSNKLLMTFKTYVKTNEELMKIQKSKDKFFANITHELKTPLTSIFIYSDLIENDMLNKNIDPTYKENVGDIKKAAERLSKLIHKVLDISKIASDKMILNLDKFNFDNLILRCLSNMKPIAKEKNVAIKISKPKFKIQFYGDEEQLESVILNILSNAIKFIDTNNKKGVVNINYKILGKKLILEIKDNGVGIKPKDISKVLSEYEGVSDGYSRIHSQQGTGLGLPLSKKIVELHGGTLKLKSEVKKGTLVKIILPIKKKI